jgi:hypothetical protein
MKSGHDGGSIDLKHAEARRWNASAGIDNPDFQSKSVITRLKKAGVILGDGGSILERNELLANRESSPSFNLDWKRRAWGGDFDHLGRCSHWY